jgi:hypothetical protein
MMFVLRYVITFKSRIPIWEGPIACLMFAQFMKTNVHPIHGSYGGSFHSWVPYQFQYLLSLSACLWVLEPAQKCSCPQDPLCHKIAI